MTFSISAVLQQLVDKFAVDLSIRHELGEQDVVCGMEIEAILLRYETAASFGGIELDESQIDGAASDAEPLAPP